MIILNKLRMTYFIFLEILQHHSCYLDTIGPIRERKVSFLTDEDTEVRLDINKFL